jgi:hypothetical protein
MPGVKRALLLGLTFALTLPAAALAQGSFAGIVQDASGAILPGVTVEASSPALIEGVRSVTTDGAGQYRIVDLRPGTYALRFVLPGFSAVRREGLVLTGSRVVTVNAEMAVGGLEETVVVTGDAPTVDVQSTQRQHVLDDEVIAALPAGRSHYDLGALVPGLNGVQFGRAGWQDVGGTNNLQIAAMSIHGGSFLDTKVAINGLSSRNLLSSSWASNFIADTGTAAEWTISYAGQGAEAASSGVTFDMIPKEGGNRFSGSLFATGANESVQADNFTPELEAQGLRASGGLYRMYDINPSGGGPILRDRLWFYASARWQTNQFFIPGSVGNANAGNPDAWFWEPDESIRGKFNTTQNSASIRLTYQANPKHKFAFSHEPQSRHWIDGRAPTSPESFTDYQFHIQRFTTASWTAPLTNRVLAEVKWADHGEGFGDRIPDEAPYNTLITVHEEGGQFVQPTHYRGRGHGGNQGSAPGYNESPHIQQIQGSLSYVTGSHSLKFGFQNEFGQIDLYQETVPANVDYYFINRVPDRIRQWALPIHTANRLDAEMGIYAQDTWTLRRATINAGLRFDYYANSFPEQHLGPGLFVPDRNVTFPETDFYRLKDLTPRVGFAYDLFGTGKTAVKAHWGKYVEGLSAGTGNPIGNLSTSSTRTWRDANGNFDVDCNLLDVNAQDLTGSGGDFCGPNLNRNFGLSTPSTERDPETYRGWGNRQWNQTLSVGVQHEVLPRVAVDLTYYRRWSGNFTVTDNRAVSDADFTAYSVVAPETFPGATIALPDGAAGRTTSGFYDVNPSKIGQVDNYITLSRNFGDELQVWNGFDVTVNARLANGLTLQGGVSSGAQTTDNCEVEAALPETAGPYCRVEQGMQTQVKFLGTYLIPRIDVQIAGTFQNNPGPVIGAIYNVPAANISGLGRPLSSGATNVRYDLLEPNSLYGERVTQLDLRMSKIFRMPGTTRLAINFDLANLLNRNDILGVTTTYGAAWQTPTAIIDPRLFKLGVQLDF